MCSNVLDAISLPHLGRILSAELRRMVRAGTWPWQVRAGPFSFSHVAGPVGSGPNFRFDLRNVQF